MFEIIIGSVVVISLILIIMVISYNKFQFAIIEIEEAENNIDILLHKKLELLDRTKPIIIKELNLDSFLENIQFEENKDINLFELNLLLKKSSNEFFKVLDDNEKLLKSDTLVTIIDELDSNEIELTAAIKFYNAAVVIFNKLVSSFPICILGFFKNYKKKKFYDNENKEIYDILNDK